MQKLILITAVAVVLGGPLALADNGPGNTVAPITLTKTHLATSDLLGRCAMLDAKFQQANAMHKFGSHTRQAAALHTEGEALCSSNQPAEGVKYLSSALKVMNAQPRM